MKKGSKHSAATRKKQSEIKMGEKNPMFGKTGEKSHMYGKKLSAEHKKKISDATSEEKNPMYGKNHTAATIKKQSEARIGERNPMFGMTGEKNPMFGRTGEKSPNYKHGRSETKEYICAASSKRRAAKKNQTPELTEIEQNKINFIYELAATMADVHVDHYRPLSKGGLHHPDNLQILDAKLNLEKNDKWPLTEDEKVKYRGLRIGENMSTDKQLQNSAGGI